MTSEHRCIRNTGGWANVIDGLDTELSVAGGVMAATGVGLLTTIIDTPVAIGLQAGVIASGLLGAGGRFICWKLEAKARKHDQIQVLVVSKLNSIADRISAALTDDKISEEEFRRFFLRSTSQPNECGDLPRASERGRSARDRKKTAYEPHER